ncbi:hypothetical protein GCM10020254_70020 [Streptomyces goshikiensis]
MVALRAALIAAGLRTPAEIEAAAHRVLAEREVRATLAALAGAAASVRYHRADVTDERAVRAVVAGVRARHGRLDGIVHGAGTLRDALLRDKEPAAFAEVFTTKVTGARHLAAAAAEHGDTPRPRLPGPVRQCRRGLRQPGADRLRRRQRRPRRPRPRMGGLLPGPGAVRRLGPLGGGGGRDGHPRTGAGVHPARCPADRAGGPVRPRSSRNSRTGATYRWS